MKETRSANTLTAILVLGLCAVWAGIVGYWRIFSEFAAYDDEGYLMMTVRQVTTGSVLYDQVYTQYGPAYYLYKSLLVQVLGVPLTHDATRLTTLVMWVLMACVAGLLVHRLTRSAVFAGIGFIVSFYVLSRTVFEPGHPQELAGLVTVLVVATLTIGHRTLRYCLVAILLAVLCLIKINLGVFLGSAIGVALLCSTDLGRWTKSIKFTLGILAIALPNIMFYRFGDAGWMMFAFATAMALLSAGVIGFNLRRHYDDIPIAKMALCFLFATLIVVGLSMAMGSSASGISNGVLLQHLRFGNDFVQSAPYLTLASFWAIIGVGVAERVKQNRIPAKWLVLLKICFGMATIGSAMLDNTYNTNTFILLNFAIPFAWLGLISDEREGLSLSRLALVFASILTTLQVFPITGTQQSYGTVLCALVGVVCASDAVKAIEKYVAIPKLQRLLTVAIAAGTLVAAGYFTVGARRTYLANTPLELPGTTRIRLPEEQVAEFRGITDRLRSQCDTFISMPGMYSLYFWAEKDPPTTLNTTAWMSLLDERQQREIVEKARSIDRLCTVYHPQWTANGSRNRDLSQSPLANYILTNFQTTSRFGEYEFMQRKPATP